MYIGTYIIHIPYSGQIGCVTVNGSRTDRVTHRGTNRGTDINDEIIITLIVSAYNT